MNLKIRALCIASMVGLLFSLDAGGKRAKRPLSPHQQLLEEWQQKINQKRQEEIQKLEASSSLKDNELAAILRKRTRLDPIKICDGDKVIYLQLQKSISGFLGGRPHPFDPEKLGQVLQELHDREVCVEDGSIKVYNSTKIRPLWGITKFSILTYWAVFFAHNDLYSAQITLG